MDVHVVVQHQSGFDHRNQRQQDDRIHQNRDPKLQRGQHREEDEDKDALRERR